MSLSKAVPASPPALRGHRRGSGRRRLAGVLLAAGALLALGSSVDDVAVFGSQVVQAGTEGRDVGVLFGSVTVVVDGPVFSRGRVLFGSADCETGACGDSGPLVRSYGAFGSVEVVTKEQYEAERAADRDG